MKLVLDMYTWGVAEGNPAAHSGRFVIRDASGLIDVTLDWGDGEETVMHGRTVGPGLALPFYFDHRYADDGNYYVTMTAEYGPIVIRAYIVTRVSNVPPYVHAGPDCAVPVGQALTFTGSFSDPGTADTHTILWDFDDGESAAGTLTPEHAYDTTGTYTVLLQVTDDDGGVGKDTLTVTVTPSAVFLPLVIR